MSVHRDRGRQEVNVGGECSQSWDRCVVGEEKETRTCMHTSSTYLFGTGTRTWNQVLVRVNTSMNTALVHVPGIQYCTYCA